MSRLVANGLAFAAIAALPSASANPNSIQVQGANLYWSNGTSWSQLNAQAGTGGSSAAPTAKVGLAAVTGTAATFMTSDSAPPLDVTITPTWSGSHTFSAAPTLTNAGDSAIIASSSPGIRWQNTSAGTDAKNVSIYQDSSGNFRIQTLNDALSTSHSAWSFSRSAVAITAMYYGNNSDNPSHTFYGAVSMNSTLALTNGSLTITGGTITCAQNITANGSFVTPNNASIGGIVFAATATVSGTITGATIASTGTITAAGNIQTSSSLKLFGAGSSTGSLQWYVANATTDQKYWDSYADTSNVYFRAVNDAYNAANTWLQVTRSGYVPSLITLNVPTVSLQTLQLAGNIVGNSSSFAYTITANTNANFSASGYIQLYASGTSQGSLVNLNAGSSLQLTPSGVTLGAGTGTALTINGNTGGNGITINNASTGVGVIVNNTTGATSFQSSTPSGKQTNVLIATQTSYGSWTQYIPASSTDYIFYDNNGGGNTLSIHANGGGATLAGPLQLNITTSAGISYYGAASTQLNALYIQQGSQNPWYMYMPAGSSDLRFYNVSDRMAITASNGIVLYPTGTTAAALNVQATAGTYSAVIYGSTTSAKSYGLIILAGTTSADLPFAINNAANTISLFSIWGDGHVINYAGGICTRFLANSAWHFDTTGYGASANEVTLTNGTLFNLPAGSGEVIIYAISPTAVMGVFYLAFGGVYAGFQTATTYFSTTSGTASRVNIYYNSSGGYYVIQNNSGSTCTLAISTRRLRTSA